MNARTKSNLDNRLRRGREARHVLMRAAEKVIADKGLARVSISEILREARQNNSSALQYHFGSLKGLITAIHAKRSEETRTKRAEMMNALLATDPKPDLRRLCEMMILPSFELSRTRPDFRRYVRAFGHQLTLHEDSAVVIVAYGGGGASGVELAKLLRQALPHLSEAAFWQRMDFAVRLSASAMYAEAKRANSFRGEKAKIFLVCLIDALLGVLSAPDSSRLEEASTGHK